MKKIFIFATIISSVFLFCAGCTSTELEIIENNGKEYEVRTDEKELRKYVNDKWLERQEQYKSGELTDEDMNKFKSQNSMSSAFYAIMLYDFKDELNFTDYRVEFDEENEIIDIALYITEDCDKKDTGETVQEIIKTGMFYYGYKDVKVNVELIE